MSGWGCPHEIEGRCMRVKGFACDPGMKGCVLSGRFRFSNETKNRPAKAARTSTTIAQHGAQRHEAGSSDATEPPSR